MLHEWFSPPSRPECLHRTIQTCLLITPPASILLRAQPRVSCLLKLPVSALETRKHDRSEGSHATQLTGRDQRFGCCYRRGWLSQPLRGLWVSIGRLWPIIFSRGAWQGVEITNILHGGACRRSTRYGARCARRITGQMPEAVYPSFPFHSYSDPYWRWWRRPCRIWDRLWRRLRWFWWSGRWLGWERWFWRPGEWF